MSTILNFCRIHGSKKSGSAADFLVANPRAALAFNQVPTT